MKKNIHMKGFTLVELLVSMVVISIIGSVILIIFFSILRGTNKTNALISVRQNGNYAVSQMTKIIREAKTVSCTTQDEMDITTQDGLQSTLSCENDVISLQDTSGVVTNLTDESTVRVSSCSFSCSQGGNNTQIVDMSFTASQKNADAANENASSQEFKTSVVLRNSN